MFAASSPALDEMPFNTTPTSDSAPTKQTIAGKLNGPFSPPPPPSHTVSKRVHETKPLRHLRLLRVMQPPVAAWWYLPTYQWSTWAPGVMQHQHGSGTGWSRRFPLLLSYHSSMTPAPASRPGTGTGPGCLLVLCCRPGGMRVWRFPQMRIQGRGLGCLRPFVLGTVGWVGYG